MAHELTSGMAALQTVVLRHESTGVYRCTGPELQALREAVAAADAVLPVLGTKRLTESLLMVERLLAEV